MIAYILKSSISLVILFGLYWFLLRREKLFIFNRFFLIFSILFSLSIPFISIPVNIQDNDVQKNIITAFNSNITTFSLRQNSTTNIMDPVSTEIEPSREGILSNINFIQLLSILYSLGVIILLIRFFRNIFFISRQKRKSEKIIFLGQKLVLIDQQINPFCFFNTIFVWKQDYLKNKIAKELLEHELEHIKQSHSIDVIFIELIQIFYWFNPILILFNRAIRVNHEYLADNGVIQNSRDIKGYAEDLINFISTKRNIPLTSGLNPSLTKKRLIMMTKSKSKSIISKSRIIITLSLVMILTLLLSLEQAKTQSIRPTLIYKDAADTLLTYQNPLITNTILMNQLPQALDTIKKKVTIKHADNTISDNINNEVIVLLGRVVVTYGEIEIKADSIVINEKTHQLFAAGRLDKSGMIVGKPIFKDGSQKLEAEELSYNFKTQKGLIKNINVQENEAFKGQGNEAFTGRAIIGRPDSNKLVDNLNNDPSNPIVNTLVQQDRNSAGWWQSIVKKHGIQYESYTIHNEFVIFGNKTVNNDLESFKDFIAISNSNDYYWIYRSPSGSYNIKNKWLKINDCTMEKYDWNSKTTEFSSSFTHVNFSVDFNKGFYIMADTLSTALLFSQEKLENKVIIKGTWEYSQKDFTGTTVQSSSGQVAFTDVKMVMSNKNDSIKMIKAKQVFKNLDDNKWHFETGEVSTYNKFGEGKKQSFDKLEVVATPFSSDNKK